jgi:hypothetical protein
MLKLFRRVKDSLHLEKCHQRRDAGGTKVERRTRRGASRAKEIEEICELGKMHAKSMRDGTLEPALSANERKNYDMYMREAIASARRVTDPALRDRSVGHIVDLCMVGGEEGQAGALLSVVQSEFVRREITRKHPQLAESKGLYIATDLLRHSG